MSFIEIYPLPLIANVTFLDRGGKILINFEIYVIK